MMPPLIEAALRALLIAVAVGFCLRVLRVRNVFALKAAWIVVLAASLAMPTLMRWSFLSPAAALVVPVPRWAHTAQSIPPRPVPPATDFAAASASVLRDVPVSRLGGEATSLYPAPSITQRALDSPRSESRPASASHFSARFGQPWSIKPGVLFRLLYLAVCVVLLLRFFYGVGKALRFWFRAGVVNPAVLPPPARVAAHGISIRSTHAIPSPLTIGSGILLPADFASWDAEKIRIVLAHERSHIRHGDFYLQLLAGLYATVFWFSPLGWWLKRTLSDLGETISDRAGLREAASRSSYALILFEFALAPRPTLEGVAMARPSRISQRVEKLLNESTFRQAFAGGLHRILVAGLVIPAALVAATTLVRVQAATQTAMVPAAFVQPGPHPASQAKLPEATLPSSLPEPALSPAPQATTEEAALVLPAVVPTVPTERQSNERAPAATFERTLSPGSQTHLSVFTGSGDIVFSRGSGNQIHVSARIFVNKDGSVEEARQIAANPPIEQDGDTVRIGAEHNDHRGISIDYTIEAPADVQLNAASGSGDITDTGVGSGAKLTTGSGNVTASGLSGNFVVQTGSGDVRIDNIGEGDGKLQTGSGNIEVKDAHGALTAQTGSGDIKASGTPSSNWRLAAGSGNIQLSAGNAGFNLDASTNSGSINTAHQIAMHGDTDHHHVTGPINGGGPTVRLETGSGDVRVD